MITAKDERVCIKSKYADELENAVTTALEYIKENFMTYAKKGDLGYTYKFSPYDIVDAFDKLIMEKGFEIDGRTLKHAHGIGNNNKWDIVDRDIVKVGEFYANDNMYNGVYVGAIMNGETIGRFELCSGGFIRD